MIALHVRSGEETQRKKKAKVATTCAEAEERQGLFTRGWEKADSCSLRASLEKEPTLLTL